MGHEGHDHDHDHEVSGSSEATDPGMARHSWAPESRASFAPRTQVDRPRQVLRFDAVGGAAGDMTIAALLDLGVPRDAVEREVAATGLTGYRLDFGRRIKHAISARSLDVHVDEGQPQRDYATIRRLLESAPLSPRVGELASRAFLRLAEAEAKVHHTSVQHVHFHEVGAVDAIVDVVGASTGVAWLEERAGGEGALAISVGPLPLGQGRARSAHGPIPVPAPAALELMRGLPVCDAKLPDGMEAELVTPTGAALIRAFTELLPSSFGRWPTMRPLSVGYGAGVRDFADRANVLRLVLGEPLEESSAATHLLLEANVDDLSGELAATAIEALFTAGALDAWTETITMKKGRPALKVCALVRREDEATTARALLGHTGSLGVRVVEATRHERPRRFVEVDTPYGSVRVKVADGDDLARVVHPELEDCRRRAEEHGVPVREVVRAAIAAVG
ncbi:MAG: nickel pincer cofactor biosynthesis protein LarC [Myxococcales bacterium]|nr:nickel pincer cofactor biosynthesis protein LarC [Myxococcales bacterium]